MISANAELAELAEDENKCSLRAQRAPRSISLPHQRKQNDVPDRKAVRQQHDEPIDPDAFATGRRHAVFQRADVILVHLMGFEVAARAIFELRFEPPPLLVRIVELAEGIGDFEATDIEL